VGESGSGKTTIGRTILRALKPTEGEVLFRHNGDQIDVAQADKATLKGLRRHMQMIFQDPYSSLNPRMTVFDVVGEPLAVNGMKSRKEREERVKELLAQVGLNPHYLKRYPHAFSGGQRQRLGIARALALNPRLVVADEPVSALDVSVQAQVLNLLQEFKESLGLTYLFITHDLSVVGHLCDRVVVMYAGQLVEEASVQELYQNPLHPYTEALMAAVPIPDPERCGDPVLLPGEMADPSNPPSGCRFHPRCSYVQDSCREEAPEMEAAGPGRRVRCLRASELALNACRLDLG
jgi:peptide/nickel transport system ATP-binding protein